MSNSTPERIKVTVYDNEARLSTGEAKSIADYRGKVLLIVNVASNCGFTPQYQALQSLYERYNPRGLEILAFPCDQFAHQEPGSDAEIRSFCETNYGVTFPLFAKIDVNGARTHPLFAFLKSQKGGLLGSAIKWNFTKFLVNRQGDVVGRFPPTTAPDSLSGQIEAELARQMRERSAGSPLSSAATSQIVPVSVDCPSDRPITDPRYSAKTPGSSV